ncbi:MAG: PEP-CTERM sorting domain-containing protein [Nitrosomonas sp.]|nr:PEP-CTERM sorting domain-containing protein [Nitrosomonas sp.]
MFSLVRVYVYVYVFVAAVLLGSAFSVSAANLVTNGSMTGPTTIGSPPPSWNSVSTDGDTIPVGGLSGWGTGIGASPDGGTFLAILNNGGGGAFDAAAQTVSGFTVGAIYTLEFSFSNIGLDFTAASNYANPGFVRANIAGLDFDTPVLTHDGFGSQRWFSFSSSFSATATSMDLTFSAVRENSGVGGYAGGVDGVSISAVPEPETYAMLMAGLGLMGFVGRRRAKK